MNEENFSTRDLDQFNPRRNLNMRDIGGAPESLLHSARIA